MLIIFEAYGDRCLTEDPYDHGPKTKELLQNMEFPELNGNPLIDDIIDKCWHNKYVTVSELVSCTKALYNERTDVEGSNGIGSGKEGKREERSNAVRTFVETSFISRWLSSIGGIFHRLTHRLWCGLGAGGCRYHRAPTLRETQ